MFETFLSPDVLKAYVRHLPDFEDEEALERAFAHAAEHADRMLAVAFFIAWPHLSAAADLIVRKIDEIDGAHYGVLNVAADALAEGHPLAATLVHRRMIASVLDRAVSKSYPYAARNLAGCTALAPRIDWSCPEVPMDHTSYVASLREKYGRKMGFWSLVR